MTMKFSTILNFKIQRAISFVAIKFRGIRPLDAKRKSRTEGLTFAGFNIFIIKWKIMIVSSFMSYDSHIPSSAAAWVASTCRGEQAALTDISHAPISCDSVNRSGISLSLDTSAS